MTTRHDLIETLRNRQRAIGASDGEFARRLGISRQMWQAIRTGEREPGRPTLQRITTAYPDLLPDVVALFLPRVATNVTVESANVAEEKVPA